MQRQKAAYRRGQIRTAAFASAIFAVMATLALVAGLNTRRANQSEQAARAATNSAYRYLYDANCDLAQLTYETGNVAEVRDVLAQMRPQPQHPDLRGFEWYYLQQLCHQGLHTLKGITGSLLSITFSPDGKLLASSSEDHTVRLWNTATWQVLRTLNSQGARIAFSPDGSSLAVGSRDLQLWDVATGRLSRVFQNSNSNTHAIAFSPDGKALASVCSGGLVRIWDFATGKQLRALQAHSGRGTYAVAFSPDGASLATGGDDKTALIWDVKTGRLLHTLKGHNWYVYTLAFSPDGQTLATAGGDAMILLWNVRTGHMRRALQGHTTYIYDIAFSPDGKTLASASWDQTARLWDPLTGEQKRVLRGHTSYVWCLAFSPDNRMLATGACDSTIKLWDITPETEVRASEKQQAPFQQTYLSPNGRLIGCDNTGTVRDLMIGRPLFTIAGVAGRIAGLSCSYDGGRVATLASDRMSGTLWNASTGQQILAFTGPLVDIVLSPDGQRIVTVYKNKTATLWDIGTGRPIAVLTKYDSSFGSTVFSSDSRLLAAACKAYLEPNKKVWGEVLRLWDSATGRETGQYFPRVGFVQIKIAFAPDGRLLAESSMNGKYAVAMDIATGRQLLEMRGHTDVLTSVAFSPDGRRILTGSLDDTVRIWDAATGRRVFTLDARPLVNVSAVAFSSDGRRILAVGRNNTVKIWDAASDTQVSAWEVEGHD